MPLDGDNLSTTEMKMQPVLRHCDGPLWNSRKVHSSNLKTQASAKDIKRTNTSLYSPELLWLMWLDSRRNTNGGYKGNHHQQLFCFVFDFCQEDFNSVF